jgi:hypothetical protein
MTPTKFFDILFFQCYLSFSFVDLISFYFFRLVKLFFSTTKFLPNLLKFSLFWQEVIFYSFFRLHFYLIIIFWTFPAQERKWIRIILAQGKNTKCSSFYTLETCFNGDFQRAITQGDTAFFSAERKTWIVSKEIRLCPSFKVVLISLMMSIFFQEL